MFDPQRVEELEKENSLLKTEKEEMNRRIQQQAKNSAGKTRTVSSSGVPGPGSPHERFVCSAEDLSSSSLETELDQERERYQNLLKEFSRLEMRYENLKEEVSLSKVRLTPGQTWSLQAASRI